MERFHDVAQLAAAHTAFAADASLQYRRLRGRTEPDRGTKDSAAVAEELRYCMLREAPPTRPLPERDLAGRYDLDLVVGLGNLLQRTVGLIEKLRPNVALEFAETAAEQAMAERARAALVDAVDGYDAGDATRGAKAFAALIAKGQTYVDDQAPWAVAKAGRADRVDTILATLLEVLRWSSVILAPIMPLTAQRLRASIALPALSTDAFALDFRPVRSTQGIVHDDLCPRLRADDRARIFGALGASVELDPAAPPPQRRTRPSGPAASVTFDEFSRLDLRIGTVVACERVHKSEKLLRLEVDLGDEVRTIVAGVGRTFAPDDVVGTQVLVVANLAPITLMGIESRGLVLAVRGASGGDGDLAMVGPSAPRPNGARIA